MCSFITSVKDIEAGDCGDVSDLITLLRTTHAAQNGQLLLGISDAVCCKVELQALGVLLPASRVRDIKFFHVTDVTRHSVANIHEVNTHSELDGDGLMSVVVATNERGEKVNKVAHWTAAQPVATATADQLFCLRKIHKDGVPLRPVVASMKSVTSNLCTYLARILKPLTGQMSSHTDNSTTLARQVKEINLEKDDILFCMEQGAYFRCKGSYFSQTKGAAMGSPLSPMLAEVFMEHLQVTAFSAGVSSHHLNLFKRFPRGKEKKPLQNHGIQEAHSL
ncbi:LOW QUALITY PROTEIN: hypothetical protein M514_21783 [Trichuris suis]|uniref:Reverse transcriptase domain-containing protein n=1 Tax=Trichuris suis TaxID=68888 RepID=A0A085N9G1_9BILA|nr:LOW QUALITY PROTEIN: hypothetical protein M514_21783 [Trichuris suis]